MNLKVLKDLKCSPYIIEHSKAVLNQALEISRSFNVDLDLIESGSLLHDVGRTKTDGIFHAVIGAQLLEKEGFSSDIVNITARHIGAGIPKEEAKLLGLPPKDYLPLTLEEKIVAHADNLINGKKVVDIDFILEKWKTTLGEDHNSLKRLINLHNELFMDNGRNR